MNRGHQLRPAGGPARRAGPRQHRAHVPVGAGRHRLLRRHRRVLGGEPGQRLHRPHGLRRRGQADDQRADRRRGRSRVSPVTRIFTIDPAERDQLGPQPARHRARRRRHARLRRLPDDARRHRRGSGRQHRRCSASAPSELPADRRSSRASCAARSTSSPRARSGPTAAGAAAASCHPDGRTDNVTWSFEAGPRQTIVLDGTFSNIDGLADQRLLNWTPGARREPGLRAQHPRRLRRPRLHHHQHRRQRGRDHARLRPQRPQLRPRQLRTGRCSRTTSPTGSRSTIRSAIAPPSTSGNPARGRDIFGSAAPGGANCVACHSGAKWTTSRVTYDPGRRQPGAGHGHRHRQHRRSRSSRRS